MSISHQMSARELTDRIRRGVELLWDLVIEAYTTHAWAELGYESWDSYCTAEFGTGRLRLPREERQEIVGSLRDAGLTQRAIAAATGVDEKTVRNDIAGAEKSAPTSMHKGKRDPAEREEPAQTTPEPAMPPPPPPAAPAKRPPPAKPAPATLTLYTHDGTPVEYPKPAGKPSFNESTGEGISWAAWSWNPVTGCLHGCEYCYARDGATSARLARSYPVGFTPLFHHERLPAPANTTIPARHQNDPAYRRVFVCSMADLYGKWVPDDWINKVHESMLASPQWEYLLLTKFPSRYTKVDLPPSAWVGTSVDEQRRVPIAESAFRKIEGVKVKWLSLEPLRGPLRFTDLSMFDWIVIGAQTATNQPGGHVPAVQPEYDWWHDIYHLARESGCKVHLKPNLITGPGSAWPNEFPGSE